MHFKCDNVGCSTSNNNNNEISEWQTVQKINVCYNWAFSHMLKMINNQKKKTNIVRYGHGQIYSVRLCDWRERNRGGKKRSAKFSGCVHFSPHPRVIQYHKPRTIWLVRFIKFRNRFGTDCSFRYFSDQTKSKCVCIWFNCFSLWLQLKQSNR